MGNYEDDQVARKALIEAAEVYNEVLRNAIAIGLSVDTEVDGSIYPTVWREIT